VKHLLNNLFFNIYFKSSPFETQLWLSNGRKNLSQWVVLFTHLLHVVAKKESFPVAKLSFSFLNSTDSNFTSKTK